MVVVVSTWKKDSPLFEEMIKKNISFKELPEGLASQYMELNVSSFGTITHTPFLPFSFDSEYGGQAGGFGKGVGTINCLLSLFVQTFVGRWWEGQIQVGDDSEGSEKVILFSQQYIVKHSLSVIKV